MSRFLVVITMFLAGLPFQKMLAQNSLEQLLPGEEVRGNWTVKDSIVSFANEDLYLYINGGADTYLEYGFEQVVACKYHNSSANRMHIEIYKMKDPDAAFGIFSLNSTGLGQPLDLGDQAYQYDYYLDVWKTKYFIRSTLTRREDGALDTLRMFTETILDKIKDVVKMPLITGILNLADHPLKDLKYLRGQIALNNVFNFGHGSVAAFQEAVTAKSGELSFFVFQYLDERKRREWFASAKGKMNSSRKFSDFVMMEDGFTVKDKYGKTFAFKPYKQFFMVIRGKTWEEAKPLFEEMMGNIDTRYP